MLTSTIDLRRDADVPSRSRSTIRFLTVADPNASAEFSTKVLAAPTRLPASVVGPVPDTTHLLD
jgi:hypothetical protein